MSSGYSRETEDVGPTKVRAHAEEQPSRETNAQAEQQSSVPPSSQLLSDSRLSGRGNEPSAWP